LVSDEAYNNWNRSLSPEYYSGTDIFGGNEPRIYEVGTSNLVRSFETSTTWHLIIWNLSPNEAVDVFVGIGKILPVFIILLVVFAVVFGITTSILSILLPIAIVISTVSFFTREDRRRRLAYYEKISAEQEQKPPKKKIKIEKPVTKTLSRESTSAETVPSYSHPPEDAIARATQRAQVAKGKRVKKEAEEVPFSERVSKLYDTLNFQEMVIFGVAIALLILGLVLGITISWIIFGPLAFVSIILGIISYAMLSERQKLQRNLISLVLLHGQISLKEASELLGVQSSRLINAYLDVTYDNEGVLYFDTPTSLFITGEIISVSSTQKNQTRVVERETIKRQSTTSNGEVLICSYCGFENKTNAVFCASCGASQTK
jgi:ABC-type multidrug transport system fused ATPase/permease subunit